MLTVRCTVKLLLRLKASPVPSPASSSNRLGDWYVTILAIRPAHLILLVNEPTAWEWEESDLAGGLRELS